MRLLNLKVVTSSELSVLPGAEDKENLGRYQTVMINGYLKHAN